MQVTLKEALADLKAGRLDAALMKLRALPRDARNSEPVLVLLGNVHAKAGNAGEAGLAFLQLSAMPLAARANYARMAVQMLSAAGQGAVISANAATLIEAAGESPGDCFEILAACEAGGDMETAADHVGGLDLSNPHHAMLGLRILRGAERFGDVIPFLDRVLSFHPDDGLFNAERFSQALKNCDFAVAEECASAIMRGDSARGANMSAAESLHRRLMWSDSPSHLLQPGLEKFLVEQRTAGIEPLPRRGVSPAGQKIRIAYLSNDYSEHATMILLRQVLLEHDEDRFEFRLFCFTHVEKAASQAGWVPALREKIISVAHMGDREAAVLISAWKADILVDLKGFTGGARSAIVKLSDAPVKVGWLGYPGSSPWIDLDYCITDRVVSPAGAESGFEEKLCRMPEAYQPNDAVSRPLPQSARREDHGLPGNAFVFASFNAAAKLNRKTIALWARLLHGVEGSVFWCLAPREPGPENICNAFEAEGIEGARVIFAKPMAYAAHINRVSLADLAVDTFPCGGHTTTSDLLWAGVPVLTLAGETFASRVSASLLNCIGAPELIADDDEAYVERGIAFARNPDRIAALRSRIVANRYTAPLFDSERFTRHLEMAFEMMAGRARDGLRPDHIDVPGLPARKGPFSKPG